MTPSKTFGRLFYYLKPQSLRLIVVLILRIAYVVGISWAPFQSAFVVDKMIETISSGVPLVPFSAELTHQMILLIILYIMEAAGYYASLNLMASVSERLSLVLRKEIAAKLNRLPLSYFDEHKSGEVLSRVTSDLDKLSEVLQTGVLEFVSSVGNVVCMLGFMLYYSLPLTCVFLVFMAILLVITSIVSKSTLVVMKRRQKTLGELSGYVEESYSGRDVIRAYNRERASLAKVGELADANAKANLQSDFLSMCLNPIARTLTRAALGIIAVLCGWQILLGTMTIGVAQAFFQYVTMVADPLVNAMYLITSMQGAVASAQRTFELLDEEEEVEDSPDALSKMDAKGDITFSHVKFGYNPKCPIMSDVSFDVKRGTKVAIVGPTGAGKTTLVNLLLRFYEIDSGDILLDGVSTRDIERDTLRSNFGMVLQDTWLFAGTVGENIAYGSPDASVEEIKAAAKAARVDHFVRTLPEGYSTILDNEGSNISQGQRQLITIARVFLKNPPIIILDEATSSVDTRTELAVSHAMDALMHGRTAFIIAHRLSTIRDADLILYMENGDIIESGTHDELLAKGGAYEKLYASQFE